MGIEVSFGVLGIPKTLELLDRFGCVCRHLEYDQYPEKHLYVVAQKRPDPVAVVELRGRHPWRAPRVRGRGKQGRRWGTPIIGLRSRGGRGRSRHTERL